MTDIRVWLAGTHRELRRDGTTEGSGSVLLRRRYAESIDEVWSACTRPERLARWFGDVSGETSAGGTVRVDIGERELLTCRILTCQPPRELVVTWAYGAMPEDRVALRLAADGEATTLELEHYSAQAVAFAEGGGAGWEDWLYRLGIALGGGDGRAPSSDEIQPPLLAAWTDAVR